jgi:trehalose-phosphatase
MTTLDDLATTPTLLVVSDFDGTLAGFNVDPMNVPVNTTSIAALEKLSTMPNTKAAILSGRHLEGLRTVAQVSESVILAGSHGAETNEHTTPLTEEQQEAMAQLSVELHKLTEKYPKLWIETKPLHMVVHTRPLEDASVEAAAAEEARALCPAIMHVTEGKHVVEFSAIDVTKGSWITTARDTYGATAVLFIGDDQTDENGFHALGDSDMGIKVGDGDTAATVRVNSLDDVADVLTTLATARAHHLGL